MKSNTFWIIVAVLVPGAIITCLASYWMVGLALAVIAVVLLVSRLMQTNNPKPTE